MAEDLAAFARAMDRCWLENRFDALRDYIAEDVVMVAPGGAKRMRGADAAIASYREFMGRSIVRRFEPSDFVVTQTGEAGVVEYRWRMEWESAGAVHAATGAEVLVLARRAKGWRVIWRTQIPT